MHAIESPDAAERFIRTHTCAECGVRLSVAWGGGFGVDSYVIRCSRDPKHEGMERTGGHMSTGLQRYEPGQALQVFEKRWGTLAPNQKDAEGAKLCDLVALGFDPILHLQLYQGRVTTTIDGMYWWVSGDKRFERMVSEPIAPNLKDAYGLGPDDIGVITKLYVKGLVEPFCTGFGKANMKTDRNPVSKDHPYRMGEKRSENQAIRKLRPIGVKVYMPEEVVEGELVDTSTGEIQEPPVAAPAAQKPAPSTKAGPAQPQGKAPAKDEFAARAEAIATARGWDRERFLKEFEPRAVATWREATPLTKAATMDVIERDVPATTEEQKQK